MTLLRLLLCACAATAARAATLAARAQFDDAAGTHCDADAPHTCTLTLHNGAIRRTDVHDTRNGLLALANPATYARGLAWATQTASPRASGGLWGSPLI